MKYEFSSSTSSSDSSDVKVICKRGPRGHRGEKGCRGHRGKTGPTGSSGLNGSTGPTGATGSSGLDGSTGPIGPTGVCSCGSSIQALTDPSDQYSGPLYPQGSTGMTGTTGSYFFLLNDGNVLGQLYQFTSETEFIPVEINDRARFIPTNDIGTWPYQYGFYTIIDQLGPVQGQMIVDTLFGTNLQPGDVIIAPNYNIQYTVSAIYSILGPTPANGVIVSYPFGKLNNLIVSYTGAYYSYGTTGMTGATGSYFLLGGPDNIFYASLYKFTSETEFELVTAPNLSSMFIIRSNLLQVPQYSILTLFDNNSPDPSQNYILFPPDTISLFLTPGTVVYDPNSQYKYIFAKYLYGFPTFEYPPIQF